MLQSSSRYSSVSVRDSYTRTSLDELRAPPSRTPTRTLEGVTRICGLLVYVDPHKYKLLSKKTFAIKSPLGLEWQLIPTLELSALLRLLRRGLLQPARVALRL